MPFFASYMSNSLFPKVLKTRDQLVTAEESLFAMDDSSPLMLNDEHSNTSLDPLSFMPTATLDTASSFSVFSDLSYKTRLFDYSTFVYGDNLELETISLVPESEFKMSFGEFLNSHWTEWTSNKVSKKATTILLCLLLQ